MLTPHAPIWEDAVEAMEWAADHAGELGAEPRRLIVAGEGRGAALAARLALRARDHGWPEIERQLLVRPELDAPELHASSAGAAPATVELGGDARWYIDWMRRAGVDVGELHVRHDKEKGTVTTTLKRFTIVRWIDAPPERVFDTWLDRGRLRARLGPAPIAFRDVTRPGGSCSQPPAPTRTPTPRSPSSGSARSRAAPSCTCMRACPTTTKTPMTAGRRWRPTADRTRHGTRCTRSTKTTAMSTPNRVRRRRTHADRDFEGRQPYRLRPLRLGTGGDPVSGALGYRKFKQMEQLASCSPTVR